MTIEMKLTNGELIRKAREDAQLDQRALGLAIGVSRETVCRWETNRRDPSARQLKAIERATGCEWLWDQLSSYLNPLTSTYATA